MTPSALQLSRLRSALRSSAAAALAGAMVWSAAGCSISRPEARAVDARIGEAGAGTTRVDIDMELRNSGDDEVELIEYEYVVSVGDGASYGGKWAALRALPPGQVVRATIPAVLPTASIGGGQVPWRVSGTLRYRDPQSIARILYESGILKTEVGFSGAGQSLRLSPAPPAAATGQ